VQASQRECTLTLNNPQSPQNQTSRLTTFKIVTNLTKFLYCRLDNRGWRTWEWEEGSRCEVKLRLATSVPVFSYPCQTWSCAYPPNSIKFAHKNNKQTSIKSQQTHFQQADYLSSDRSRAPRQPRCAASVWNKVRDIDRAFLWAIQGSVCAAVWMIPLFSLAAELRVHLHGVVRALEQTMSMVL